MGMKVVVADRSLERFAHDLELPSYQSA